MSQELDTRLLSGDQLKGIIEAYAEPFPDDKYAEAARQTIIALLQHICALHDALEEDRVALERARDDMRAAADQLGQHAAQGWSHQI